MAGPSAQPDQRFPEGRGRHVSYGAFAKGGGSANIFEQNIVWCERACTARRANGWACRWAAAPPVRRIAATADVSSSRRGAPSAPNLIASCSDDGIYLNSAARSSIVDNTLLDTGGISVRFASSSADVEGNLVDGAIRSRERWRCCGRGQSRHADCAVYLATIRCAAFSATWRRSIRHGGRRAARRIRPGADLCAAPRPAKPRYGAFEDFGGCLAARAAPSSNHSPCRARPGRASRSAKTCVRLVEPVVGNARGLEQRRFHWRGFGQVAEFAAGQVGAADDQSTWPPNAQAGVHPVGQGGRGGPRRRLPGCAAEGGPYQAEHRCQRASY